MIAENLDELRKKIVIAAAQVGRDPRSVRIVAAAKTQSRKTVEEAVGLGIPIIGHNYVQEAIRERPSADCGAFEYHMIGHLQRNKAKKAAEIFDVIQTVDDLETAQALNQGAGDLGKTLGVMIQINLSGEPQKSGIPETKASPLIGLVQSLPNLRLLGLMTMPPFFDNPDAAMPFFRRLRELRDDLISKSVLNPGSKELSMGMTGDFEVAIKEGSTVVRIGTALFGPRA
ncbi:MAG: YggS family pyridoxal phosphate-dependent enzyme [Desulfomonilaceae bacterium]